MYTIRNSSDLKIAINGLEKKRSLQEQEIKTEISNTLESFKPTHILKNLFQSAVHSPQSGGGLLSLALGLGTGFISRKLLVGPSTSVLKKILGTAIQFGISGIISKNAEGIKEKSLALIHTILPSKKKRSQA